MDEQLEPKVEASEARMFADELEDMVREYAAEGRPLIQGDHTLLQEAAECLRNLARIVDAEE